MKRIISILFIAIVLIGHANAQLLWKVKPAGDATNVSYIFGTHHLAPSSFIAKVPGLEEAMSKVSALYGEIDFTTLSDPAMVLAMRQAMTAPSDSCLSLVLTPEQHSRLSTFLAKYMPEVNTEQLVAGLNGLKPAAVISILTPIFLNNNSSDSGNLIDAALQNRARCQGIEVRKLEDAAWQMQLLMDSPIAEQAAELVEIIDNPEKFIEFNNEMLDAYTSGNLNLIHTLLLKSFESAGTDKANQLLYQRNDAWMAIIAGILSTASVIIVVGAGHLPGPHGLLNLLSSRGYEVSPVTTIEQQ